MGLFDSRLLDRDLSDEQVAINYIAHSCVLVRHSKRIFLFDFFFDEVFEDGSFLGLCPLEDLEDFDIYIFNSHGHGDHWSKRVLSLPPRERLYYVLSFDIALPSCTASGQACTASGQAGAVAGQAARGMAKPFEGHSISICNAGNVVEVGDLRVLSPSSSDEGVAFFVEAPGFTLYHSGDNAFWDWNACRQADGYFKDHLQPVIDENKSIDIAFQVADPRCHETHYGGIFDISKFLDIDLLIPIHNFNDFSHHDKMYRLVKERHPGQNYWNVKENGRFLIHDLKRK